MQGQGQRLAVGAAVTAVLLGLAGAAAAALVGHAASARTTTIRITEREYHMTLSTRSVAAGKVTFVIRNTGKLRHEFAVVGGGLAHAVRAPAIAPGATRPLTVTFTRGGTVKVWCPLHSALGMSTSFAVKGGTTAPATTPAADTTTGGSTWG